MKTRPPRYYFYRLIATHYKTGKYVVALSLLQQFTSKFWRKKYIFSTHFQRAGTSSMRPAQGRSPHRDSNHLNHRTKKKTGFSITYRHKSSDKNTCFSLTSGHIKQDKIKSCSLPESIYKPEVPKARPLTHFQRAGTAPRCPAPER